MTRLEERILSKERVFDGKIIDVERWQVELPNGGTAPREVVLHRGAAAIVAVDEQGRVALVRQFRAPLGRVLPEIPAGKKDSADEDPLVCAHRELLEETGLTAQNMLHLTDMISTPGFCSEVISLYLATGLTQGEARPDEDEFLSVEWMALELALEQVRQGQIADSKTALGLLLAAEKICSNI